jgi:co-chaperonin GroES (HSP10)
MIKPTGSNVFVTAHEKEATTASGIILTGETETGSKPGVVQAIGNRVENMSPGDLVYLRWDKAMAITYEGVKGALINQDEILAVDSK